MNKRGYCPEICFKAIGFDSNTMSACMGRAIFHPRQKLPLDFPNDRVGFIGDTEDISKWFSQNFNEIQRAFSGVNDSSIEWIVFQKDGYSFVGNPNGSYGYLYFTVFKG